MDENEKLEQHEKERREFLGCLGSVIASGVAAVAANSVSSQATAATQDAAAASQAPAIPGYDWSKHQWAFGVDAEKCIGCLRCVEACKTGKQCRARRPPLPHLGRALRDVGGRRQGPHRQPGGSR